MVITHHGAGSNAKAALALVSALVDHLVADGTLIPKDIEDIKAAAAKILERPGMNQEDQNALAAIASFP